MLNGFGHGKGNKISRCNCQIIIIIIKTDKRTNLHLHHTFCTFLTRDDPQRRFLAGRKKLGVATSGVERSSCDARVQVLPKRQNKMANIVLDRKRDYPAKVSHYPVALICCKQQQRNKLFLLTFVFCCVHFFPREQTYVLNIVPPP